MKRTTISIVIASFFFCSFLFTQTNEADEAYIKAMTANSPAQRAQLLKEYIAKYGGKGTQYENFAHANLCLLNYPGKTPKETIDYGEKALALGGLDDLTKAQVLITLSGVYLQSGQNIDKAKTFASQVIELARVNKEKEAQAGGTNPWNNFIAAGYFLQGQAFEKAKDPRAAVDPYINSYNLFKGTPQANQVLANLKKVAKSLYDAKLYADAEKAFKNIYSVSKDIDACLYYARSLYRNDKEDEALTFFKEAYSKQKSGEAAYNVGIILAKKSKANPAVTPEAIRYLLEASFLYPSQSQQAMSLAENLFFTNNKELKWNETIQQIQAISKKIEDMTATFNEKFGDKAEEDLNDAEKKEMKTLLASIEAEKKNLEKLQAEQNLALAKFNQLLQETKQRLGVK